MDLDRTLRATFDNLSTLFLVVFGILFPLHLIYGWIFQDVFAVRELHAAIAEFPATRQVRGVGQTDVEQARLWFWILIAIEIALLPLILRACRAVIDQDNRGEVTSAPAAWRAIRGPRSERTTRSSNAVVVPAFVIAVVIAALAEITLRMTADFLPDTFAFAALALASAAGRSLGIPFVAVALASSDDEAPSGPTEVPDLY